MDLRVDAGELRQLKDVVEIGVMRRLGSRDWLQMHHDSLLF